MNSKRFLNKASKYVLPFNHAGSCPSPRRSLSVHRATVGLVAAGVEWGGGRRRTCLRTWHGVCWLPVFKSVFFACLRPRCRRRPSRLLHRWKPVSSEDARPPCATVLCWGRSPFLPRPCSALAAAWPARPPWRAPQPVSEVEG